MSSGPSAPADAVEHLLPPDEELGVTLLAACADAGAWELASAILATYPLGVADRILEAFHRRVREKVAASTTRWQSVRRVNRQPDVIEAFDWIRRPDGTLLRREPEPFTPPWLAARARRKGA